MSEIRSRVLELKSKLGVAIAAHYYQRDEIVEIADFMGDSLELSRRAASDPKEFLIFCGVGFMAQSVKIIAPFKRVLMPKIACCSMAKMIDGEMFDRAIGSLMAQGVAKDDILPIAYINSNADVKARVGKMGGSICTSANAERILRWALEQGGAASEKRIFFAPDRCLGLNLAAKMGLSAAVLRSGLDLGDLANARMICFDGFCSVHQLFTPRDVDFYREKYAGILIAAHPECDPAVVAKADFVGSTSQIIKFARELPSKQKIAVGTEFNLVNRLREAGKGKENTFVLSATKPECPTMNETRLSDLLAVLESIDRGEFINEIFVDENDVKFARVALDRMLDISGK
ncbi:MAG: quinolinate synthase NadA [Helicobacteraceae bacterium]|jgi:quinolinate synthase|nr:quinolinate synthase NadA [Helicobacteraceae bacterium]